MVAYTRNDFGRDRDGMIYNTFPIHSCKPLMIFNRIRSIVPKSLCFVNFKQLKLSNIVGEEKNLNSVSLLLERPSKVYVWRTYLGYKIDGFGTARLRKIKLPFRDFCDRIKLVFSP